MDILCRHFRADGLESDFARPILKKRNSIYKIGLCQKAIHDVGVAIVAQGDLGLV